VGGLRGDGDIPVSAAEGSWDSRKRTRRHERVRTGTRWMDLSGAGALATAFVASSSAASASSSAATLRWKDLPAGDPRERRCIAAAAAAAIFIFCWWGCGTGARRGIREGAAVAVRGLIGWSVYIHNNSI